MTVEPEVEQLLEKEPYEILTNPDLGNQYRLLDHGSDSDGEFLRFELRYLEDSKHFPEHVHPRHDEIATVLSGAMSVRTSDEERTVDAGERFTIPAGTPHIHRNASGPETRALVEIRPPGEWVGYIRAGCGLARDGKTDGEGIPNLLAVAVLQDTYPNIAYAADLPITVQKLLFRLLAPIGRLRGYTADYPVDPDPGSEQASPK